jgi:uncharacterized cysteine cluster protein YcgN (CxxCxxCC family)
MAKMKISLNFLKRRPERDKSEVETNIQIDSDEWEKICRRCGACCYDKLVDENDKLIKKTPCRFLDLETRMCKVYEHRFEIEKDCIKLTPENIKKFDWLPDDCGYVVYFGLRRKKGES